MDTDHDPEERGGGDADAADREVDDARRAVDQHDAHGDERGDEAADDALEHQVPGEHGGEGHQPPSVPKKTARSPSSIATLSDCSTMIIVWPRALSSSTTSSSRCTTSGARPSESSSIMSSSGSWIRTRPSASICC